MILLFNMIYFCQVKKGIFYKKPTPLAIQIAINNLATFSHVL
jgi:hypothetical protein